MNSTAARSGEPSREMTKGSGSEPGLSLLANGTPETQNLANKRRYRLSQEVSISELDTSHSTPRYQLSNGEQRFQINGSARRLLDYLREPRTMGEIEDLATGSQLRVGDVTELRSFVEGFLVD